MNSPDSSLADAPGTTAQDGVPRDVFAARRRRFLDALGDGAAALVVASPVRNRSNDTHHDYRPSSNLLYLTGFEEPGAAALFLPGHDTHEFVLFLRDRDPKMEIWDGLRVGVERAPERLGCDRALAMDALDEELPKLIAGREPLFYAFGLDPDTDLRVIRAVKKAQARVKRRRQVPRTLADPAGILHEMRLVKAPEEIEAMRRACAVSAAGHVRGIQMTRPGLSEYELQAEIEYVFQREGARSPGYPSIVGAGANACILHYVENRDVLRDGDLVLVDAGAEVDWYTGDITRTWPVNGEFTGHQRTIYDLVLHAQEAAIRKVRPGLPWKEIYDTTLQVIGQGLIDLGILQGSLEEVIETKAHREYYMHGAGHWLGIDVHDVGEYADDRGEARRLEPGMAFTIEPGIYFHPELSQAPDEWKGIGVRIEDNILVTEGGCEVMTSGVPKEPEDLMNLVGSAL